MHALFVCSHWRGGQSVLPHIDLHVAAVELHLRADVTRGSAAPPRTSTHMYLRRWLSVTPSRSLTTTQLFHQWWTLKCSRTSPLGETADTETALATVQMSRSCWVYRYIVSNFADGSLRGEWPISKAAKWPKANAARDTCCITLRKSWMSPIKVSRVDTRSQGIIALELKAGWSAWWADNHNN